MKKSLLSGLSLIGLTSVCLNAEPSVKPVGLALQWEALRDEFGGFPALNQNQPVKLVVVVDMDGKNIISLNEDQSKVTKLTDDGGKNLDGKI